MFNKLYTRWMIAPALAFALIGSLAGANPAAARSITEHGIAAGLPAQVNVGLSYTAAAALAPGAAFTYDLTVMNSGPGDSQGTAVTLPLDANVVVDDFASADGNSFVEAVDASSIMIQFGSLGAGASESATVYAHLLASAPAAFTMADRATVHWDDSQTGKSSMSNLLMLGVGTAANQDQALQDGVDGAVDAGTLLTITGNFFGGEEAVGLWLNAPAGTILPSDSLGQTDSALQGSAIALDAIGYTDTDGLLTYTLDTTGLPSGTYSLVAHGLGTSSEGVVSFTIK